MTVARICEADLAAPLLRWLESSGRINDNTLVVRELPWYGRRVDIATLNASKMTSAFELKLRDNRRAIEQAARNTLTFDRSYVVTATSPTERSRGLAAQLGVGLLVVDLDTGGVMTIQHPNVGSPPIRVRQRLRSRIRARSGDSDDV